MSDKPQNENDNKPEELTENELDQVSGGKGLEAQDRMGNFEIQDLMSSYNQAETLSSNVQKKMNDTVSGQQSKIG